MKRTQQGFTLIELVIVIVILGVLSAFALPRFADLGSDARASTIQGATGSIRAASAIVRSACLASDACDESEAEGESVSLEGEDIDVAFGFPTADGILLAAQLAADFDTDVEGTTATIRTVSRAEEEECQVTYTEAAAANSRPTITPVVTGC